MTFAEFQKQEFGYECVTTFWEDFSIADHFGAAAVKDTYNRAFHEWRHEYKYLTEFVIVLNHKCWQHYNNGNIQLSQLYHDLYHEANNWAYENLKGDELKYYFDTTD